jgi:membrane protein DedA with SNARE-associated domain
MSPKLRDRPPIEFVIIVFSSTVCVVVFMLALAIVLAGTLTPNTDESSRYLQVLISIVATLLGALLGLLAGTRIQPPAERRTDGTERTTLGGQ